MSTFRPAGGESTHFLRLSLEDWAPQGSKLIVLFIIEQIVNSVHVCTIVHVPVHVIKFSLGTFVSLCVII